jgi:hypothetical protein
MTKFFVLAKLFEETQTKKRWKTYKKERKIMLRVAGTA